jgi:hypothetical protein
MDNTMRYITVADYFKDPWRRDGKFARGRLTD